MLLRFSRVCLTWRTSFSASSSIAAFMSGAAAFACSTCPLSQIVPSATWFAEIEGFFSSTSWTSTGVCSFSCLSSLASFLSAYVRIPSVTLTFLPLASSGIERPPRRIRLLSGNLISRAREPYGTPWPARRKRRLSEAQRAGKRHDVNAPCAAGSEGGGGGGCRRAARVDVVDEHDPRRDVARRPERAGDVSPPLRPGEAALPAGLARSPQQRLDRELPAAAELAREPLRWMVTARQHPVAIGRDEREEGLVGLPHDVDHDAGRGLREAAQAVLLPGRNEGAHSRVVADPGARRREGESAAGALAAALDRPLRRRPAAGAERRTEPRQPLEAARTQLRTSRAAREAALRE